MTPPGMVRMWNYLTLGIVVIGPDTEIITAGLNTDSTSTDADGVVTLNVDVHFSLYAGNLRLGPDTLGTVQENIRRPQIPFVSGWAGGTVDYSWDGAHAFIYDHKSVETANFNGIAAGTIIDDFYQQNRMIISDCAGNPVTFYFPEHHFQRVVTSNTTWQLIQL